MLSQQTPPVDLSIIHKNLIEGLGKLSSQEVPKLLKRSVMVELLLEAVSEESERMLEHLDEGLMQTYMESMEEYTKRLSFAHLNP